MVTARNWYYCHKCYREHHSDGSYYLKHLAYAEKPKLVIKSITYYWDERFNDYWYERLGVKR